jgi:molecular chaperone DnaK
VDIHVRQGERERAPDNMTLGKFRLEGIPPAPRGIPQVEVTFDIDANGILNVSAKDKATGKEQRIAITASTNLGKDDIDRMVRDAESHAAEDKRRRELVELKNQSDSLAYQSEKTLGELGDKVDSVQRGRIEGLIKDLRDALQAEDEDRMRSLSDELQQAMYQISQSANGAQEQPAGAPKADGDEGVVEGEYRVE